MIVVWSEDHRRVQDQFLAFLGSEADLVLKGGTALLKCYGLDRFSEDLDFDALRPGVSTVKLVQRFAVRYGYTIPIKEETSIVHRVMVSYGNASHPLKIETSYRNKIIDPSTLTLIGGVRVYTLDTLAQMKAAAYLGRDTIRDLYDVTFLINQHYDQLSDATRAVLSTALAYKGLDQFEVVLAHNTDELINSDDLAMSLLQAYETLHIQSEDSERDFATCALPAYLASRDTTPERPPRSRRHRR